MFRFVISLPSLFNEFIILMSFFKECFPVACSFDMYTLPIQILMLLSGCHNEREYLLPTLLSHYTEKSRTRYLVLKMNKLKKSENKQTNKQTNERMNERTNIIWYKDVFVNQQKCLVILQTTNRKMS